MRIATGLEGSWRTLRVLDADPGQRAALEELGFGPDLVRRYPPGTRYFDRAVANLRQVLGEMVGQKIAGTPPGWAGPLDELLRRAGQARVRLAVIGSGALAVRGVGVRPGDIDVITTTEGADALADSYQETLVMPLATMPGFGRWSRAFTSGIRVEWLGNPARIQEGQWPLAASAWSIARPLRGGQLAERDPAGAAPRGAARGGGPPSAAGSGGRHRRVPQDLGAVTAGGCTTGL